MINRLKIIIRVVLNLFFHNNNLAITIFKSFFSSNRIVISPTSSLKGCRIYLSGGGNYLRIEDECSLKGLIIFMDGNSEVKIGRNVVVNAAKSNPTRFNACDGCCIRIGEECLFSNNIEIHTTDFHPIFNKTGERINTGASINIGRHCWIGLRTVILKGVSIAPNTIIGACSLVNRDNNEEYVVFAGQPAEIKKRDVKWANSL